MCVCVRERERERESGECVFMCLCLYQSMCEMHACVSVFGLHQVAWGQNRSVYWGGGCSIETPFRKPGQLSFCLVMLFRVFCFVCLFFNL